MGSNTPKDIKAAAKAVYGKAVNNDGSDLYMIHTDYLMYNGVQMSDGVMRALYGFVAIILLIIILASVFGYAGQRGCYPYPKAGQRVF